MIPAWQPVDGATVHLAPGNRWQLPAGRYILDSSPGWQDPVWELRSVRTGDRQAVYTPDLAEEYELGQLTPISAAELARDAQELALRLAAPLRGNRRGPMRAQHDCSGLALFGAVDAPTLF